MLKKALDGSYSSSDRILLFISILYLCEQGDILALLVIVATGDFLVVGQLFLHELVVDCKTPKYITVEPLLRRG